MSSSTQTAREGALAKLATEAARFNTRRDETPPSDASPDRLHAVRPAAAPTLAPTESPSPPSDGYVPVAVAPERGNTRPVVPVDGRLHMRVASRTLADIDAVLHGWKDLDPVGLRDLERATLVRIGIAMVLADIAQSGQRGAVGEAVRAALDPAVRHTAQPMPALSRWLRPAPQD